MKLKTPNFIVDKIQPVLSHIPPLAVRTTAMILVAGMLASVSVNSAKAKNVYTVDADSNVSTVETYSNDIDTVLTMAGVDVSSTDSVDVTEVKDIATATRVTNITVTRPKYATLTVDHSRTNVLLQDGDTVQSILSRLNVSLGENDKISHSLDSFVYGGDDIVIKRVKFDYYDVVETSSYDKRRVADPDSYIGTEYIKQEGVKGKVTYTYEKKWVDGKKRKEDKLVKTKTRNMKTEITAYGTRVPFYGMSGLSPSGVVHMTNRDEEQHTVTMSDGSTYGYYNVSSDYSATAYTGGGTTSTGRKARVGVVAVDPSVIPYGTRMYITSGSIVYGVCVAGDTGVKGHLIDLYFNSESQCRAFGRRGIQVYFLC